MDPDVLYDQKRHKFLRRCWLFNYVPFVEKVFLAGSLALGKVHQDSDFDVIVVTQAGRLYTARFFCLLFFSLMGWRRTLRQPRDGFCFNYFLTDVKLLNSENLNVYGKRLMESLIEIPLKPARWRNFLGGFLERPLQFWQVRRIEKFLKKFPPPANAVVIYNQDRVELCFNLKTC